MTVPGRLEAERAAADTAEKEAAEEQRRQEKAAEARQQAQAQGLVLRVGKSKTGYVSVYHDKRCRLKPYEAKVRRGGKLVSLGFSATAEEAAMCVARMFPPVAQGGALPPQLTQPFTFRSVAQGALLGRLLP